MSASWSWKSDSGGAVVRKTDDGQLPTTGSGPGGNIDLTTQVSGVLPVANGGTAQSTTISYPPTNNQYASYDSGGILYATNFVAGVTPTAVSSTPYVMNVASQQSQAFTQGTPSFTFTASFSNTTMTVTASTGTLLVGMQVTGPNLNTQTFITVSGGGGAGIYTTTNIIGTLTSGTYTANVVQQVQLPTVGVYPTNAPGTVAYPGTIYYIYNYSPNIVQVYGAVGSSDTSAFYLQPGAYVLLTVTGSGLPLQTVTAVWNAVAPVAGQLGTNLLTSRGYQVINSIGNAIIFNNTTPYYTVISGSQTNLLLPALSSIPIGSTYRISCSFVSGNSLYVFGSDGTTSIKVFTGGIAGFPIVLDFISTASSGFSGWRVDNVGTDENGTGVFQREKFSRTVSLSAGFAIGSRYYIAILPGIILYNSTGITGQTIYVPVDSTSNDGIRFTVINASAFSLTITGTTSVTLLAGSTINVVGIGGIWIVYSSTSNGTI